MSDSHKLQRAAVKVTLDKVMKYIDKNPQENICKMLSVAEKLTKNIFPAGNLKKMKEVVRDDNNVWTKYALGILNDIDRDVIKKMIMAFGFDAGYYGTKTVRRNREKLHCNVPFIILYDTTSACNLQIKSCWAAEYGHKQSLTNEEMQSIVSQGKALGTHVYMLTGGEPLIRKNDIIELAANNQDCVFLIYTNATLVDQKFCDDLKRVGNVALAMSIEGTEESNDWRRGEGAYNATLKAMELLKKNKCLFGISVCYTSKNDEYVTSDDFIDKMIENGSKFAFYFNYMPVGHGADKELIPTPDQREYMYRWLRKMRNGKTGKPMFVMDFQDDGEYVGGCIAAGRNYFHINSAGDIEPCVFIHYSDTNIRTHTLLEALKSPLFTAYYKGQPFNDKHLRPCPLLENPELLRKIVKESGAHSSDLLNKEDVDELCDKCVDFANEWAPRAEKLWNSTKHRDTHTQYYRDTEEGKREFGCSGNCAYCASHAAEASDSEKKAD